MWYRLLQTTYIIFASAAFASSSVFRFSAMAFKDLQDLIDCALEGNPELTAFDCSVFNGEYVTGDIDDAYLDRLAQSRNDGAKTKKTENVTIDLANIQEE